jgi:hypothetical protein
LNRSEPGGEGAIVRLDQVRDGPLDATDDAAVDHDRPVFGAVRADVLQVELFWLVEVDLDGGQGRLAARAVGDLHVDFGTVERRFPFRGLVRYARAVEDLGQQGAGLLPHIGIGDVLPARPRQGQPVAGRADAKSVVRLANQLEGSTGLVGDLLQGAEDMCVVELDRPYPGQPAQDSRQL